MGRTLLTILSLLLSYFAYQSSDLCKKTSLPCPAGEKFRDAVTCRQYYECGHNGQFMTKRLCPSTLEFDPQRGHCVRSTTFKCPPPIRCPNLLWNGDYFSNTPSNFPTDYVVGGVLGTLAVMTVLILILACLHKWRISKSSRRRLHQLRKNLRNRQMVPVLENRDYYNDKMAQIYERISNNNSMSCLQYPSAFRPVAIRHHPISQMRYPHPLGDIDSLGSSDPALYVAGGCRDDSYEPSIVAGSFIYHGPGNLPSHLSPTAKERDRDLSYDSFKNEHLFSANSKGVMNSTVTTRQLHL